MKTLIITDIFAKKYLSLDIVNAFSECMVLDPYFGRYYEFCDEEEAYVTFINECGHENYLKKAHELCQKEDIEQVVGFSIGGGIAWRLASLDLPKMKNIVSFYPSQIRHYSELNILIPIKVVFAKEDLFDITVMSEKITQNKKVSAEITQYRHGFMNKKSMNFSKMGFKKYIKSL